MFTEEELLRKFDGDVYKAAAFMEVFIAEQEAQLEEMERLFHPDSDYMKALDAEISRDMDLSFMPLWKLVLVKLKIIKR